MGQQPRTITNGQGQRIVVGGEIGRRPAPAPVILPPPPNLGGVAKDVQMQRMGGPLPSRQMGQQPMPIALMQRLMMLDQMRGPDSPQEGQ